MIDYPNSSVLGPGNGMDVWFSEMKMLTGRENMHGNDAMIVGEGVAPNARR